MVDEQQEQGQAPEEQEPETPETGNEETESQDDFDKERAMKTIETLRPFEKQAKKQAKEIERLQKQVQAQEDAEKSELQKAQDAAQAAQDRAKEYERRVVRAEARATAAEMGIDPKRIPYAVKLLDLDDIEVSDDGEPDSEAIRSALETITKDIPELVASKQSGKVGGTNPPQNDLAGLDKPYDQMSIEEQTRLFQENPSLWQRARDAVYGGY